MKIPYRREIISSCNVSFLHSEHDISPLSPRQLQKNILSLTWPCLLELFLVSLVSMVNLMRVGHLGAYAINAIGITSQPAFISIAVFQAFNIGATTLVSRFIGAGDYKKAKEVVSQTLLVALLSGSLLCFLGFFFSYRIVVAMGAREDTVLYAALYMRYMSIGIIFQALPAAVSSLLRGAGETKTPMRYNIVSNIINILLGYILIFGFKFIPAMGLEGAAISETLAKAAALDSRGDSGNMFRFNL